MKTIQPSILSMLFTLNRCALQLDMLQEAAASVP